VKLIWEVSHPAALQEADDRSRQYTSTDEWGADRQDLHRAFLILGETPTVDAFASRKNTICQTFFSKWPQLGGAGVDFFAQTLSSREIYFCCPPVAEAAHTIRKLCSSNNITAILVLPAWHSALHWALLRTHSGFIPEVRASTEWTGRGQDTGRGVSLFGLSHNTNFWAGLIQTGSILRFRHNQLHRPRNGIRINMFYQYIHRHSFFLFLFLLVPHSQNINFTIYFSFRRKLSRLPTYISFNQLNKAAWRQDTISAQATPDKGI
jgi:hypothetical protein